MAEEILRRNLGRAFDPGPDFPSRLLLSRTMAILDKEYAGGARTIGQRAGQGRFQNWARPRMRLVAVLLTVLIAVAATAVFITSRERVAPAPIPAGKIIATIKTGPRPEAVAVGSGSVWVASCVNDSNFCQTMVSRVDPATNSVTATIPVTLSQGAIGLAADDSGVWASDLLRGAVWRIDPHTNRVAVKVVTEHSPFGVAIGEGAVWVASTDGYLIRIDPDTNSVVATVHVTGAALNFVAIGAGSVWVHDAAGFVIRIDPKSNQVVSRIPVPINVVGLAIDGSGRVWVDVIPGTDSCFASSGDVREIDPATNLTLATVPLGHRPSGIVAAGGSIWVADQCDGTVTQINASTGESVGKPLAVGGEPRALAAGLGALWVNDYQRGTLIRIHL
ncbi:MAG TPA: hypothetical protein VJQ08_08685 [Candidatus Dormibacteraeota bacterium]|nr:hypothetical protein [Candidatus Dormibacteraeota bacterium]